MNFAGVRRLRRGRSFRGFWLRITQLYPVKEITLWIKPWDAFVLCEEISFQNLLGMSLTAWGIWIPNFLGKLDWTLLGKFWIIPEKWLHWMLIYRRGTIFRTRLPGMLVKNVYAAGECWDLLEDTQLPWDLITLLGEECADCWITLWGIKMPGYVL